MRGNGKMIIKKVTGKLQVWGFFRLFTYALPELGDVSNLWYVPNMLFTGKHRLMNLQLPQS